MENHAITIHCLPRSTTLEEEEAILAYYEKQGADYYEVRNELSDGHLVVYDDCSLLHSIHCGTVIVVLLAYGVEIFDYDKATAAITLLKKFGNITPEEKAHTEISEGETV